MDHHDIHALRILEEIEKDNSQSQRQLARKLNMSLGLVNSFIKRLAHKGYFKITTIPKNRARYILTPKGFAEKTRLTYEFIQYSFHFYKTARGKLKALLHTLENAGVQSVIFYGASDLAEIAYVSLEETSLTLVGIVDDFKSGERFLGLTIMRPSTLTRLNYDKIIVTSISSKDAIYENLSKLNIPKTKISWLE
ncbi:MAG: winged helix-turn-helix transcriptional regulator [Deltaproteobacteria bacterium]|nr:winged helix-turn-helix transcriptional regulator [Deltaproteobacteria bacterium]MBW2020235.1 winged helix-turn-helix transcriptional regulator [Deltaproteobacteria bacterium]MBW2075026.1 winged helix-turn-helix transcriptional regulator [Deltaproteobacteria bacterium]